MWHRNDVKTLPSLMGSRMNRLWFHAFVVSGYANLTIILTYPLILRLSTHIPTHPTAPGVGGPWMYMWAFGPIHRIITRVHLDL